MIRNVVFDVGGVLVRLRYQPFIEYLVAAGIDMSDLPKWLEKVDLAAHERGEVSGEEMLRRIAAMARRPLDTNELRARWLDMFERWHEMCDLAAGLRDEYRVFLLSNIGDLHWEFLDREIGVSGIGHGALPSFRARACKPDPAIYRKAEELFGLEPARTVFIDDLMPNLDAARQRGWHVIHHLEPATTFGDLRLLGVIE